MLDIGAGWKYYCRTCYNAMRREDRGMSINQTEREVPAGVQNVITTLQNHRFMRWQNDDDWDRAFYRLRAAIIAALEPERALRELAYLAYMVVDSGLDSGRVKTSAIKRLSAQVVKMLDEGFDFDAIADDITATTSTEGEE
jgi:hypothetical protein